MTHSCQKRLVSEELVSEDWCLRTGLTNDKYRKTYAGWLAGD